MDGWTHSQMKTSTPTSEPDLETSPKAGLLDRALSLFLPKVSDDSRAADRGALLLVIVTAAITVVTAWQLISVMNRGLELSDEGTYLAHAQPATRAVGMASLYGRYTSLLFSLVGQDVAQFRVAGFLLLALAGAACGSGLAAMVTSAQGKRFAPMPTIIAGVVGVNAAFLYYFPWLPTPSYNWLVVASMMWCLGALGWWWTGIVRQNRILAIVAATQIAAGAFLGFMAKFVAGPAMLLAACIVAALLAWREKQSSVFVARFAVPAAATLIALSLFHLIFRSGPADSLQIVRQARDWYRLLDPELYSIRGASKTVVEAIVAAPGRALRLTYTVALLPLLAPIVAHRPRQIRIRGAVYAAAIFVSLSALAFRGYWYGGGAAFPSLGEIGATLLVVLVAVAVAELLVLVLSRTLRRSSLSKRTVPLAIPLVVFAGLTAAIAVPFGSNNGPLVNLSFSLGLVLIMTTVVLIGVTDVHWLTAATFALIVAIGAPVILDGSRAIPYRQRPLAEQNVPVSVGSPPSALYVDAETANYLTTLERGAQSAGFVPGTPLLDFTQFSTTTVWALGGRTPDTVFLGHGSYGPSPEMDSMYARGLELLDLEVFGSAWILAGSYNSPDPKMLSIIGRNFPEDYVKVTEAPWWFTGEVHSLWQPKPETVP